MHQDLYKSNPVFTDYEASRDGIIRHKRLKKNLGSLNNAEYIQVTVYNGRERKRILSHRFIWECYNGLISSGFVIDHINHDKLDNRLDNLRLVTQQENALNSASKIKSQQRCPVIGFIDTEELYFPSIYSAGKYYDILPMHVKSVADGINMSTYSKEFKCKVSFTYA